ncbi:MAG: oxygenase MpaB family protein, partial [Acidimicrobiales bacterium]
RICSVADVADTPDPGFFGPGSVTWKVHSDPSALVGGIRALLMQALNPLAMAGVDQHSDYWSDPLERFQRTAQFVSTVTFGTHEDARRAARRVSQVHETVRGTDPVTGRAYTADDPELLAWVHNVLVDSLLAAQHRYGVGLSAADRDAYVEEMVRMAELVGTPPELCPTTVKTLRAYLDSAEMVASETVHRAKWALLTPPMPGRLRPGWGALDAAAIDLLPPRAKGLYGLWWTAPAAPAVRLATRGVLAVMRANAPIPPARRAAEARLAG